jgi:argininosuccinate synthase
MNSGFGAYGEENKAFDGEDAKGFIKVLSLSNKIYYHVNKDKK